MTSIPKVLLATIALLIFSIPQTNAQSKDKQATDILDEVTAKTKAYESIKMDFTYQMENPEANINETTSGSALVSGDKYRLDIAGQLVISDGTTLWTVIKDAEEVQVNEVNDNNEAFSPTKMLPDYSKNYKSKLISKTQAVNGVDVYILELTPNKKENFKNVNLYVRRSEMQPYRIEIYDYNGCVYTYTLTSFKPNVAVKAGDFSFVESQYPDYEIIDMR
ncbi:MAG: outer membrane lipoprotein carrier protein LolA [Bacteroidales bacterium]|nr:outer membrane lipoprotein carrier protein LolA [Bacteroidales bacterium]